MKLPADWPEQREMLHGIATHVLARARHQASGRFSLEPSPGGFATPTFATPTGSFRRLRIAATAPPMLVDEQVGTDGATARFLSLGDTSLATLAAEIGVELDADFSVGHDTPELGDPDRPISIDPSAVSTIGEWYALGSISIDRSISVLATGRHSVARVWPEHLDLGTDIEVAPGRRCNLGASPGDEFHPDPYLYVGPWGDERPGDDGYWNASFGALLDRSDAIDSDNALVAAVAFFDDGIRRLRA